jgi:hypothetical protein
MINIKSKICIFEGCNTIPNYNLPTETKPIYCATHKKDNMIAMIRELKGMLFGHHTVPTKNLV